MDILKEKPKVIIIVDKENWAFYNVALQIKQNLYNDFNIDIISMEIFGDNIIKLLLFCSTFDIVFFMWRGLISWIYSDFSKDYINKLGFDYEEFLNTYVRDKNIVTGVYDHLYLESEKERTDFVLNNVKSYIVCSKKLEQLYINYPNSKKPMMVISDGVDLKLFNMQNKNKYLNIKNKPIIIGWTGNSKFADDKDDDLKGLNKIIKPAVNDLIEEGYDIELKIADRNIKMIPHDEMPDYYNNIDIYVCASRTEGTPNPVLESMACGVPVISTDVGVVSEVFGDEQKKFIIERTKEDLKEKIIELVNDKKKMKVLSDENLQQIKNWSWKNQSILYKEFFEKSLS